MMRMLKFILIFGLFTGCATTPPVKDIAHDTFLRTYVQQLEKSTSSADLHEIASMSKSDLIFLLHGYGTGIRNRWLHGNRDPELIRFFHNKGIVEPEGASMVIIEALWYDLNSSMSPSERAAANAKRALVSRKRATYEKLERDVLLNSQKRRWKLRDAIAAMGCRLRIPNYASRFSKFVSLNPGELVKYSSSRVHLPS
jgi:hypothetical protein